MRHDLKAYLPTTKKELQLRGWDEVDVILFSGDAYIDHPSFGAAVIGRVLEANGYRVAIVPQPDWRGDHRDFTKLGRPRLFFAVTSGSMDSMVNHYTAAKRLRSDDAYTPEGKAGMRPDYCTITYCNILKQLYPDVPIVIGGIEASMRRLTHYDYWSDRLMPSILVDSKADVLVYGMGEKQILAVAKSLEDARGASYRTPSGLQDASLQDALTGYSLEAIPQIAYLTNHPCLQEGEGGRLLLHSHEEAVKSKQVHAENFRIIETESNKIHAATIVQPVGDRYVVVNPPYPTMSTDELDAIYDLPFQYHPHPKYKDKHIPAYEMIRFSVCMHRGCFGGCSFCTISAHQGKQITSRSEQSILRQIEKLKDLPEWKGYLSDLGGPSANMYGMHGKDMSLCEKCARPSCLHPSICKNLNQDFTPLMHVYNAVDRLPYIKKSFVGSGVRYDLMNEAYGRELITKHVSGRLKVAPEHTSDNVLKIMRKPTWGQYERFHRFFEQVNMEAGLRQQLIPYFISSHPGCTNEDMQQLAARCKQLHYRPEQVQDFTPTPMTLATTMFYTGLNPHTMEKVYVAKTKEEKQKQNSYFFWWKAPEKKRGLNGSKDFRGSKGKR
ncbi:MAG: YgiQ family radical SAM protein [Paludibacteraceae bacterium]|nr:YgiQ family radical SAM protein [Paludibacteraceae bacterium]